VAAVPDEQDLPAAGDGPARGSLAGDAAFVEAVRQLSWSDPGARAAAPPPAGSQVLFAGDVPGGRWALVSRPLTVPPPLVDDDELERQLRVDSVALAWFAPDGLAVGVAPEGAATVEVLTADGAVLASVEPIRARR
jgi:hypothetical protein